MRVENGHVGDEENGGKDELLDVSSNIDDSGESFPLSEGVVLKSVKGPVSVKGIKFEFKE
jgi:hypothetical protein